jgi:protease-4
MPLHAARRRFGFWVSRAAMMAGLFICALLPARLRAQPALGSLSGDDRPTDGVFIPARSIAGEADATGVEVNPGQLGMLGGSSAVLVGNWAPDAAPLSGRGVGLLLGQPLVFNSAIGVGLHFVMRALAPDRAVVDAHNKLQVAYSVRLGRTLAAGFSWAHIFKGPYGGLDTFDAGLSWRPSSRLALGLTVRDLGAPSVTGAPSLPRLYTGELVVRPLRTDRLELAASASHAEDDHWRGVAPRFRLLSRLADGLRLFAEIEARPREYDYAFAEAADYRGSVGLWFDLEHVGAALATRAARPGGGEEGYGGSVLLRASGDRYRAVYHPQRIDRVSLEGLDGEREFLNMVRTLRDIGQNPSTAGVLLKIENVGLGWGRVEELRDLIGALRARGKRVFGYATSPSTREYYLASACESVILHPAGLVALSGVAHIVTFYKGLMEKVGVNVDLVRIAEYKGAMEPFVMNEHSPQVRENKNQLLDDVFERLVAGIAEGRGGAARGFSAEKVRTLIDGAHYTPAEAQKAGLIDAIKDEKEIEDHLRTVFGRRDLAVGNPDPSPQRPRAWGGRRIGVVLVDGAIVDGKGEQGPFDRAALSGSDTLVAALEEFRQDATIGAVVIRVNSPGGSAFGSDVIARAVRAVKKAGKPVVVSFGDVAASGGYYVSALADAIFAEPSTTTGSIGIFGYKVDVKKLMETLGVSAEVFQRGRHADYISPYRPWTEEEIKLASEKIRHFYGLFLDTVAEGRKTRGITKERADELGRGRVWTGAQAQRLGLVDQLGGVAAAIDHATRLGRVPIVRGDLPEMTVLPRPQLNALQRLARLGGVQEAAPPAADGLFYSMLKKVGPGPLRLLVPLLAGQGSGVEARMPYDLELR